MYPQIEQIQKQRISSGIREVIDDQVAVEEPLEMRLNGEALAVTMRTPGHDFDLVRGFLYTEQIISRGQDILQLERIDGETTESKENIISMSVPPEILKEKCWLRNFYASSSCGVCGKASIEQLRIRRPIIESRFTMNHKTLVRIPEKMREVQNVFDQTGGLHAAVLFDQEGQILVTREDVGRHNAVDKTIGWALAENRLPLKDVGLFVSGRTSFEILQKAVSAGIPLVAAVSAPSSLAIRIAQEYGVTLIGFVRGTSYSVYSHPERIHDV